MTRLLTLAVGVSLAAATGLAQTTQQAPPRDQAKSIFAAGSASVTGMVVADDETRAPLRSALVTLVRSGTEDMRSTSTDEKGLFGFSSLPAGSYQLVASKGGYIRMENGAPKPGMPGRAITLAEGQTLSATAIALIRGAVIAGRFLDENGAAVVNAQVEASQFVTIDGVRQARRTSGSSGTAQTNGHGEYRIYGLLPGEFIVHARAPMVAPRGQMTDALRRWLENPAGSPPPRSRPMNYAPTMFPGTPDAASAAPISLARGEERLGVNLPLQLVPIARVSGVVIGLDGRPAVGVTVNCFPQRANTFILERVESFRTGPDGKFVFNNLGPGAYTVLGRSDDARAAERSAVLVERGLVRPGEPGPVRPPAWGMADVNVNGEDVADLSIAMQPPMSVTGRIVVQGASAHSWTVSNLRVQMTATRGAGPLAFAGSNSPNGDGTFRIDGVMPGSYRVQVVVPPQPGSTWAASSAMHAGMDLLDVPVEIMPGANLSDVVVTVKDVHAQVSGALVDTAGQPAPQLYVFVFSTNPAHWASGARRIRAVRTSEAGLYEIAGLPAGEYFLCALTELDTMLQFTNEFLEQLVPASIKITLADGEKKTQNLGIGR